MYVMEGPIKLN